MMHSTLESLPPIKLASPQHILQAANAYQRIRQRMTQLSQQVDAPELAAYLGINKTNCYVKRRGERPFAYEEVSRLAERYATPQEQTDLSIFLGYRNGLYEWLVNCPVPLVQFRRLLGLQHYRDLRRRGSHPETWRVEEIQRVASFLATASQPAAVVEQPTPRAIHSLTILANSNPEQLKKLMQYVVSRLEAMGYLAEAGAMVDLTHMVMARVEAPDPSNPHAPAYYREVEDYRQSLLEFVEQTEQVIQQQVRATLADDPELPYPINLSDYLK